MPRAPLIGLLLGSAIASAGDGYVVRTTALRHPVDPKLLAELRTGWAGRGLRIAADAQGRTVVLRGPETVVDAEERLRKQDEPGAASRDVEPGPEARLLNHCRTDPEKLAASLKELFPEGLEILARPKSNSLLLEGDPALVAQAYEAAETLDGSDPSDELGLRAREQRDRTARRLLQSIKPEFKLAAVPLKQAADRLARRWGAELNVNWRAIADAGIDPEQPVALDGRSISLENALHSLFDAIREKVEPEQRPAFIVENGVVTVSTRDLLGQRTRTVFHDARDLLPEGGDPAARESSVGLLLAMIRAVDPATFTGDPDSVGQIHEWHGILMIRQTAANQERIRQRLADLRRTMRRPRGN